MSEVCLEHLYRNHKDWREAGESLAEQSKPLQWQVADWMAAGEELYGDPAYAEAEEVFGYAYGTLRNMASVARNVSSRNDKLSFAHHMAVASLPPEEQKKLLDWAVLPGGARSVSLLRSQVKAKLRNNPSPNPEPEPKQSPMRPYREPLRALSAAYGRTTDDIIADLVATYLRVPATIDAIAIGRKLLSEAREKKRYEASWEYKVDTLMHAWLSQENANYDTGTGIKDFDASTLAEKWEAATGHRMTYSGL